MPRQNSEDVAKPQLKAAAVQYNRADSLPSVLSAGEGKTAQKILELAEQHGIPIKQDASLSALLEQVPAGATVPETTFELIAEVLCFLYQLDQAWKEKHSFMSDILPEDA